MTRTSTRTRKIAFALLIVLIAATVALFVGNGHWGAPLAGGSWHIRMANGNWHVPPSGGTWH